jgi:carbamoyltransferase
VTAILGISAFYHDSAAALVVDGEIVAAAQEERFTRRKHDPNFPANAVQYCLGHAGITPADLDHVGFYDKPFLKFERLLETYLSFAPSGYRSFAKAVPIWLAEKLHLPRLLDKQLDGYEKPFVFAQHHESHAASAFFPSPFDEAAIITLDGVGEWATATFGSGRRNKIALSHQLRFPHSLGLLYSAFTYFTGFKVNSGEYKLMGLAPYGQPRYVDLILENLIDLKDDGSLRMDLSYFNYCQGLTMTSPKMDQLFGRPPRRPESKLTQQDMDIAASVQHVTEEVVLKISRHVHHVTGLGNLCMAGGVALNCVANGRVLREGPFERIWIQPAAGDAGAALGVAQFIWHQLLDNPRVASQPDGQRGSFLGPQFDTNQIQEFLDDEGAVYERCSDEDLLCNRIARCIADGKVVGWMQGGMEFGPRALGARSIIGDPRNPEMQKQMNLKIKFRESFRPFAPSVLQEDSQEFFDIGEGHDSPYMMVVAAVREDKRQATDSGAGRGLELLGQIRSQIPSVTHVDYSARVHTVDEERNRRYYKLIRSFKSETGCPVLINTSFNVRGEPIVCTPSDAYRCFMGTDMDVLAIGDFILLKENQPAPRQVVREKYVGKFELD